MTNSLPDKRILHEEITRPTIGAYYDVFNALPHDLNEHAYCNALEIALAQAGIQIKRECAFEVRFRDKVVGSYRADLIVEDKVLVEVKAANKLTEFDRRQLRNYLRITGIEVGLLLLFGPEPRFERIVLTAPVARRAG